MKKAAPYLLLAFLVSFTVYFFASSGDTAEGSAEVRSLLASLASDEPKTALLKDIADSGDPFVVRFVEAWGAREVYEQELEGSNQVRVLIETRNDFRDLLSWEVVELSRAEERKLSKSRVDRSLKSKLSEIVDTIKTASNEAADASEQGKPETRKLLYTLATGTAEDDLLREITETGEAFVISFLDGWSKGQLYQQDLGDGSDASLIYKSGGEFRELLTWELVEVTEEEEEDLPKIRPERSLRQKLGDVKDTIQLESKSEKVRAGAAIELGKTKDKENLVLLQEMLEREESSSVRDSIEEGINLIILGTAEDDEQRAKAIIRLGELHSVTASSQIESINKKAEEEGNDLLFEATSQAIKSIEDHSVYKQNLGSLVRGISTGSILLIVAFGLAITFGLMGIINMAHGEFVAIGAYTCYEIQNIFAAWFGTQSSAFQWFFWVSLPAAFIVAAIFGFILEKGIFRFLYKRPLESLLATWGLSMAMRWGFRRYFGANNKSVENPEVLFGSYEIGEISMSYARIFGVCFTAIICVITWIILSRTNLGLYIRAVMQNRKMASSIGIPVSKVNSMTFAFGCGLAALAGVLLTQIANVGPTMGKTYIVDSFMVVVVGGVGNLVGAGVSAMGIGVFDQLQQPYVGPIMGKIIVLFLIILFLQWRPGGLFASKSRSLDD